MIITSEIKEAKNKKKGTTYVAPFFMSMKNSYQCKTLKTNSFSNSLWLAEALFTPLDFKS